MLPADVESYREARLKFEREYLREALREAGGKPWVAALLSGIDRASFYKKLQNHPGLLDAVRLEFEPVRRRHSMRMAEMNGYGGRR